MKSHALLQPGIVAAGAVACMVGLGWNIVPSYAASLVASAMLGVILLFMALPKRTKAPVALSSEWGWRPMLRTGWPMLLGSAMFLVMSWTDTLLLGHFLEEEQVGIYRVAFRMAAVVTLVQAAVNSYAAPLFAERHASGDRAGLKMALRQTTLLNVAFSLPAFVALVVMPAWWMGWFGDAFAAGATCLVWLAVGQVVNALCGPVMYLLNMTGHERPAQRIVWIAALGNLALNVWAIPRFGIEGAAVATAFSMALWNVAAAVAVKRLLGLSVWDAIQGGPNTPSP
jgi:O-antigen/teichoic acid export membrane protein